MYSPFLLQCFGAFFDEGSVRLVLEFMDCGSLETIIKVVNELTKGSPTPMIPRIPELVISRFLANVSSLFTYMGIFQEMTKIFRIFIC